MQTFAYFSSSHEFSEEIVMASGGGSGIGYELDLQLLAGGGKLCSKDKNKTFGV
jgi:hypothetical protein